MSEVLKRLFALSEEGYGDFQARLAPNIEREKVIGVRTPVLRALAKELYGTEAAAEFMAELPHEYMEENSLHGLLIELIKDYDQCVAALNVFLPYVDNWATCDIISPKVFKKHRAELIEQIKLWIADGRCYVVRFGLEMLMSHFLDGDFKPEYLELAAGVHSEKYYVKMMIAWYFATALAKQYDAALPYIEAGRLDRWTHNKAIQKAQESYRVSEEHKKYLKTLKL